MLTATEVRRLIRGKVREMGNQARLARLWNIAPAYLCDVMNGNREPGPKILRPLGLRQVIGYEPAKPSAEPS